MTLVGFTPRITMRPPTDLERGFLGEMIGLIPAATPYTLPTDARQLAALYGSAAEAAIERGLVGSAIECLQGGLRALSQVRKSADLSEQWTLKQKRWERWKKKMEAGQEECKKAKGLESAKDRNAKIHYTKSIRETSSLVAETLGETLPVLAHQVLHKYGLEAALVGAMNLSPDDSTSALQEQIGIFHLRIHQEMFRSPVCYSGVSRVVMPESVSLRAEIVHLKQKQDFEWRAQDDQELLDLCETIHISPEGKPFRRSVISSYQMLYFVKHIAFCRESLEKIPLTENDIKNAEDALKDAKTVLRHFSDSPPRGITVLLEQMALFLERTINSFRGVR